MLPPAAIPAPVWPLPWWRLRGLCTRSCGRHLGVHSAAAIVRLQSLLSRPCRDRTSWAAAPAPQPPRRPQRLDHPRGRPPHAQARQPVCLLQSVRRLCFRHPSSCARGPAAYGSLRAGGVARAIPVAPDPNTRQATPGYCWQCSETPPPTPPGRGGGGGSTRADRSPRPPLTPHSRRRGPQPRLHLRRASRPHAPHLPLVPSAPPGHPGSSRPHWP